MAYDKAIITKLEKRYMDNLLTEIHVEFDVYDKDGTKQHNAIKLGEAFLKTLTGTKREQTQQVKNKLKEIALIAYGNMVLSKEPVKEPVKTKDNIDPFVEFGSDEI